MFVCVCVCARALASVHLSGLHKPLRQWWSRWCKHKHTHTHPHSHTPTHSPPSTDDQPPTRNGRPNHGTIRMRMKLNQLLYSPLRPPLERPSNIRRVGACAFPQRANRVGHYSMHVAHGLLGGPEIGASNQTAVVSRRPIFFSWIILLFVWSGASYFDFTRLLVDSKLIRLSVNSLVLSLHVIFSLGYCVRHDVPESISGHDQKLVSCLIQHHISHLRFWEHACAQEHDRRSRRAAATAARERGCEGGAQRQRENKRQSRAEGEVLCIALSCHPKSTLSLTP